MNQSSSLMGMSASGKENSLKLYCNKCQIQYNIDKFNHSDNIPYICCCFQLKDTNHIQHYSDRSQCCQVCANVEIINQGLCNIPGYKSILSCNLCSEDIKLYFMNTICPSLSNAHDYLFIVEFAKK